MSGLGFGLERIGLVAMTKPRLFMGFLAAMTAVAFYFMFSVSFNGSVTGVLPKTSENYLAYEQQKSDFRNFARDVAVIVRSEKLQTAAGLEALRDLQLELSLTDGVLSAISVLAVPELNLETGDFQTFFPAEMQSDAEAKQAINRVLEKYPQTRSLIAPEENAAVVLVALDLGEDAGNDQKAFEVFRGLSKAVDEFADPDFEIYYAGLTPIGLTILETLLKDQVRLTLFGLGLGAIIAIIFFRSMVAAIFCAIPPILTAIWAIGFFGLAGVSVTYMTTILPTLALVLAYADGIVMFHRWNKLNRDGDHDEERLRENLEDAVRRVGPASALTTITTAFALSSFAFSSSEALVEFAWVGVVLVCLAFLTVIIVIPVLGLALIKLGWVSTGARTSMPFHLGTFAANIFERMPRTITIVSIGFILVFFYLHSKLEPDYTVTDLLPKGSTSYEAEEIANSVFGGRSLVFFSVPTAGEGAINLAENRERLSEITDLLKGQYGEDKVYSIEALWEGQGEQALAQILAQLDNAPEFTRQGYISKDGERMLVSLRIPSSQSISETKVLIADLNELLSGLSFRDDLIMTGFPVLLATEFSDMIDELRRNLIIAAVLGVLLIGFATRSALCAAVVLVPNLFPILFIEASIYFQIGSISVTEVVALTLAFGIAIDNAVHVINVFQSQAGNGLDVKQKLRNAVVEVAPALSASTLIICAGTAIGLTSTLPILITITGLIVATLGIALFTNLIILPANILTFGWLYKEK